MQKAVTGKRCLVVLDEMFRGTNAKDAFEASVAVNELLKSFSHCHFLISTHILEYAKAFEKDPSCCFYYMEAEIIDDAFVCPHRLLSRDFGGQSRVLGREKTTVGWFDVILPHYSVR